jgi:uncharacterized protein (DUF2384 family)
MATSFQDAHRLITAIAHALAVFGDEQKAIRWFSTPLALFNNQAPHDMVSTDEGF